MNLDELRSVRQTERETDSLQSLRESFYRDATEYINELKAEREAAAEEAADLFSSAEVRELTDTIETAEQVLESLYERRVGKVVKLASFTAAGMGGGQEGLTAEEQALFDDLVDRIRENRAAALGDGTTAAANGAAPSDRATPAPAGGGAAAETADGSARDRGPVGGEEGGHESDAVLAAAMGGEDETGPRPAGAASDSASGAGAPTGTDDPAQAATGGAEVDGTGARATDTPPGGRGETPQRGGGSRDAGGTRDEPASDGGAVPEDDAVGERRADPATPGDGSDPPVEDTDRTTVRITCDVGSILGVDDRDYDLAREDVVSLPTANADPLIEQGAADRLE